MLNKDKRELLKKRKIKENKPYELSKKAKVIWEEFRRQDCPKEEKIKKIESLMSLIDGKVKAIITAHDTVRVIECIVANGTNEQRSRLFKQLEGMIVDLSKTKYAKFFIIKMLKYGTKEEKDKIIKSFYGKVKEMMKHGYASSVLEYAYNEVANAKQRGLLSQEYFGTEFSLFKDENKLTLGDVLPTLSTLQRTKILEQLKEELIALISKGSIKHSLTHYLLREFFKHADSNFKHEMTQQIRELVVEILHTKDGSRVALHCLWNSNAKDRKIIVKSFKRFVTKIATEENGYLVLLAAFDVVDDTKLIEKVILSELCDPSNAKSLMESKHAIKVFEYLISPRDPRFFHKDVVAILSAGDANPFSKKDQLKRWEELKEMASSYLCELIKANVNILFQNGVSSHLIYNILANVTKGDKKGAFLAIVDHLNSAGPYFAPSKSSMHLIEQGCVHFVLNKIFKLDNSNENKFTLKHLLLEKLDKEVLKSYINCNRGCFLLLQLIEVNNNSNLNELKKILKICENQLRQKDFKGAKLLLEKL